MKQPKIVSVAHARDPTEETPFAPEGRLDERGLRDAAQVGAVEGVAAEAGGCEQDDGDDGAGIGVVGPVCGVEGVGPFGRLGFSLFVIIVVVGGWGEEGPWPSHCGGEGVKCGWGGGWSGAEFIIGEGRV